MKTELKESDLPIVVRKVMAKNTPKKTNPRTFDAGLIKRLKGK